jgi:hypothetical protein
MIGILGPVSSGVVDFVMLVVVFSVAIQVFEHYVCVQEGKFLVVATCLEQVVVRRLVDEVFKRTNSATDDKDCNSSESVSHWTFDCVTKVDVSNYEGNHDYPVCSDGFESFVVTFASVVLRKNLFNSTHCCF